MWEEDSKLYFLDNANLGRKGIFGPFQTIEEAALKLFQNCKETGASIDGVMPGSKYKIHVWDDRDQLIKTISKGF